MSNAISASHFPLGFQHLRDNFGGHRPHRARHFEHDRPDSRPPRPAAIDDIIKKLSEKTAANAPVEEEDLAISAEKQVNDYVQFVAQMIEQNGGDSSDFLKRVKDLAQSAQGGASLTQSGEFSAEQSMSVSFAADDSSFSFSAAYSASLSGHFTQEIQAEDGSTMTLDISFAVSVDVAVEVRGGQQAVDPLVLDGNGDNSISLSALQDSPLFDIDGDGTLDQAALPQGADFFLAWDRNRNGRIDDGKELFGDQHGAENGFEELKKHDEDNNGRIDGLDSIFSQLRGLKLGDGNLLVSFSLSQLNVESLSLQYIQTQEDAGGGNTVTQKSAYATYTGQSYMSADLMLRAKSVEA